MALVVDEDVVRTRLRTASMDDVGLGWDDGEALWHTTVDGGSQPDLEDSIRLAIAVHALGQHVNLGYRYAAQAPDESISSVMMLLSSETAAQAGGICAEIRLNEWGDLPADHIDAVVHVAQRVADAFNALAADGLPDLA